MMYSRDGPRHHVWCFRCNEGRGWTEAESLAEKTERLRQQFAAAERIREERKAPTPATHPFSLWPEAAKLWFYRAGMGADDARRIGAYYHEQSNRVVIEHGAWWQARALDGSQPKYLSGTRPDGWILRYDNGHAADILTLTEDVLSAYKLSRVPGVLSFAMAGTSLQVDYIAEILRLRLPVAIALDPDKAGHTAAMKILRTLRAYGVDQILVMPLEDDPKRVHLPNLKETINALRILWGMDSRPEQVSMEEPR